MFKEVKIMDEGDLKKEVDEILSKAEDGYSVRCDYYSEELIIQSLRDEKNRIKSLFIYLLKGKKWFRFKFDIKYRKL